MFGRRCERIANSFTEFLRSRRQQFALLDTIYTALDRAQMLMYPSAAY